MPSVVDQKAVDKGTGLRVLGQKQGAMVSSKEACGDACTQFIVTNC